MNTLSSFFPEEEHQLYIIDTEDCNKKYLKEANISFVIPNLTLEHIDKIMLYLTPYRMGKALNTIYTNPESRIINGFNQITMNTLGRILQEKFN